MIDIQLPEDMGIDVFSLANIVLLLRGLTLWIIISCKINSFGFGKYYCYRVPKVKVYIIIDLR